MLPRLTLPALMLVLVTFSALAAEPAPSTASDGHFSYLPLAYKIPPVGVIQGAISVDGLEREYVLYVPHSYLDHRPAPLILNFHAYARDAMVQMEYGDFRPLAEQTGAIIVLPQGAFWDGARRWNVGGIYTHPLADDVAFTAALLDVVSTMYHVDQSRIYSAGFSNGGYMSYLLACQLSQRIAAVAVVAGSMTPEMLDNCQPVRPLPVLQIHGLADSVVPYGGDNYSIAVEDAIAYWLAADNNHSPAVITTLPDADPFDGSTVTQILYDGGDGGTSVELLQVSGGGHTWPGSAVALPGTNYDINASAVIWNFFARYDINGVRATSNELQATSDEQRATSNRRPATSNQQPAPSNQQPETKT